MDPLTPLLVRGTPRELDAFLRPAARMFQLSVAIPVTLVFAWFAWWWVLPVPLAISFVWYEWFFWSRADKPLELELSDGTARISDPYNRSHSTATFDGADSATVYFRRMDEDVDVVLSVADTERVFFAIQFRVPAAAFEPRPEDVDVDLCNAVLGSIGGLIRAVAPRDAIVRQVIGSSEALSWFRATLPPEVFARTSVRGWRGAAPDLDLFGYHGQPADGLIRLEEGAVRFWDEEDAPVLPLAPTVAERRAVLFRMDGEEHSEAPERLPLWVHVLGTRPVAIPAPLAIGRGEPTELHDELTHTHPPEGAAILWHLWRYLPTEQWPDVWRTALAEARPALEADPTSATVPPFPRWLDDQTPVRG